MSDQVFFYLKIFIYGLAIALVAVLDATVVSTLPFGLYRLHLLPLALVFVVLLSNLRVAAWWALLGGLVLELFSFRFFGMYLMLSWISLGVIALLFEKVMTNRSLYSVALVSALVTFVYDILFLVADYVNGVVLQSFANLLLSLMWSLIINVVAAIIIFNISHIVSRRLRPVFLKGRY